MMATGSHEKTPMPTSASMAASTTILSASGSRNAPDRVVPWRRANHPSSPSVVDSRNQKTTAGHDAPPRATMAMSTGVAKTRPRLTALAGVARADGPKVPGAMALRTDEHLGQQIRTLGGRDVGLDERARLGITGQPDHAIDLGCLPMATPDTRGVDQHLGGRPHQRVAAGRGDAVLGLGPLGQPLGHQARRDRAVQPGRVSALL